MDEFEAGDFEDGQGEETSVDGGDGPGADMPAAVGGTALREGSFLDQNSVYDMLLSDEPPTPTIPSGRKDNMVFRIDNTFNRERIANKRNAVFSDDCGAWTSCSSKRNYFITDGNSIKHTDYKDGTHWQMVKGEKVAMDPQPNDNNILILRRYYSSLKRNPEFKRRMTMAVKFPANVTPKHDVYVAEYIGNMTGPLLSHGNAKGQGALLASVGLTPQSKFKSPAPSSTPASSTRARRAVKSKVYGDEFIMDTSSVGSSSKQQIAQRARTRGGKRPRLADDSDSWQDGGEGDDFDDEDGNDSMMSSGEEEETVVGVSRAESAEPLPAGSKIAYRLWQDGVSVYKAAALTGGVNGTAQTGRGGGVKSQSHSTPVSPLSSAEEDALFKHIVQVRECGYTLKRKQLSDIFEETSLFAGRQQTGKPLTKRFLNYFLDKHPQFKNDMADMAKAKGRASQKDVQLEYYRQLREVMDDSGLWENPQLIFTVEETQISLEAATDGSTTSSADPRSSATLLTCVSATGQTVPPFIVFQGQSMSEDVLEDALPGTEAVVCEKGLNSCVLQDFLESHLVQHHPATRHNKILVLFHGSHCHLTAPLLKWARERSILFFPLPPHRAQLMQDQDASCFQLFRKSWDSAFRDFASESNATCLSQRDLCGLICKAYGEACSVGSVVRFYKDCGLFPFVPKYVAMVRRGNTVKVVVVPFHS